MTNRIIPHDEIDTDIAGLLRRVEVVDGGKLTMRPLSHIETGDDSCIGARSDGFPRHVPMLRDGEELFEVIGGPPIIVRIR